MNCLLQTAFLKANTFQIDFIIVLCLCCDVPLWHYSVSCVASLFHFIPTNSHASSHLHDVAMSVKLTNDSSSVSKCSAARAGYYQDEFIRYFVGKHARRSPLIHRQVYVPP